MRDGDRVAVKALTAMPGVEDGAVLHVEWGPRLAALVGAGRYAVLEEPAGEPRVTAAAVAGDVDEAPAGDVDQELPRPRRGRSR